MITDAIKITPDMKHLIHRLQEHNQQRPEGADGYDAWFDTRRELHEDLGELVARRALAGQ